MQNIESTCPGLSPLGEGLSSDRAWPHPFHLRVKLNVSVSGRTRFNLVKHSAPEPSGACWGVSRISRIVKFACGESNRRVIRLNIDRGSLLIDIDRNCVILHPCGNVHVAEDLPGKDPCLIRAVLLPQQSAARSGDSKRLKGQSRGFDGEGCGAPHRKRSQRLE